MMLWIYWAALAQGACSLTLAALGVHAPEWGATSGHAERE